MVVGVVVGSFMGLVVNKFYNYKFFDILKDMVVFEIFLLIESEVNFSFGDNVKWVLIKFWMVVVIFFLVIVLGIVF